MTLYHIKTSNRGPLHMIKFEQESHPLNLFSHSFLSSENFSQSFLVFFVLDSCGQKCQLAPTAWDGRALKLSVRGWSSVTAALGDNLWPRDFFVTPPVQESDILLSTPPAPLDDGSRR